MCSQKSLYKNVPSRIIKNSKKKKRLPRWKGSGTNWESGIDGKKILIKKSKSKYI